MLALKPLRYKKVEVLIQIHRINNIKSSGFKYLRLDYKITNLYEFYSRFQKNF